MVSLSSRRSCWSSSVMSFFLRDVVLPKRTAKRGAQTPAERQAKKKQGAAERKRKSRAAKAAKEKGEEPTKDKRRSKKRKLSGSMPDCDEVAWSEDEEDRLVGATLFFN